MNEVCDQCGEELEDNAVHDDEEMTQFCSEECCDAWDATAYDAALASIPVSETGGG